MSEERMTLAAAAALLGIAPNSVRSRYKAGKIRGERDNTGRIWVWIERPQTSSAPQKPAFETSNFEGVSKPSIEPPQASNFELFEAWRGHIQTLAEQLSLAQAELAELRPRAAERDRLEGEVKGLQAQVELLSSERDAWRVQAQDTLRKVAAPARPRWRLFGGR